MWYTFYCALFDSFCFEGILSFMFKYIIIFSQIPALFKQYKVKCAWFYTSCIKVEQQLIIYWWLDFKYSHQFYDFIVWFNFRQLISFSTFQLFWCSGLLNMYYHFIDFDKCFITNSCWWHNVSYFFAILLSLCIFSVKYYFICNVVFQLWHVSFIIL